MGTQLRTISQSSQCIDCPHRFYIPRFPFGVGIVAVPAIKTEMMPEDWSSNAGLGKLVQYCKTTGTSYTLKPIPSLGPPKMWVTLQFKNGSGKRDVHVFDHKRAEELVECGCNQYEFLDHYQAIYSDQQRSVEALLDNRGTTATSEAIRHIVSGGGHLLSWGLLLDEALYKKPREIVLNGKACPLKLVLGPQSRDAKAMLAYFTSDQISLRLLNLPDIGLSEIISILKKLSDSLFFDIGLNHGVFLRLAGSPRVTAPQAYHQEKPRKEPAYPEFEYDNEPMSFYQYGCMADGMPLLQYLAYYQVLEFYFPRYVHPELQRQAQKILKSTTFDADNQKDIGRLLRILGQHSRTREPEQLKLVLSNCISQVELTDFICSTKQTERFYTGRHENLTTQRLSLTGRKVDLIDQVCRLIYDIRNQVVHSKAPDDQSERGLLLPNSPHASTVRGFVELVKFLAEKALVSHRISLSLPTDTL